MEISMDKQYRTRNGDEVRVFMTDGGGAKPVAGAVKLRGGWYSSSWYPDGKWGVFETPDDLIEVKTRHTVRMFLNVYPVDDTFWAAGYKNRLIADRGAGIYRLACIERDIEFEEGEGLVP